MKKHHEPLLHPLRLLALAMTVVAVLHGGRALASLARDHVIRADKDGIAIDPNTEKVIAATGGGSFSNYVNHIFDTAELWWATNQAKTPGPVPLLIHVHGGMNDYQDTKDRLRSLCGRMMTNSTDMYYPIFVAWPSDFLSTYGDHLLWIRQGEKAGKIGGPMMSPIILGQDVLDVAAGMPRDWFYQFINFKDRCANAYGWLEGTESRRWKVAQYNARPENIKDEQLRVSHYEYTSWQRVNSFTYDLAKAPVRVTAGTLAQSAIAQDAWEIMKRRTSNMLHPPELFEDPHMTEEKRTRIETKAVGQFFGLLQARLDRSTNKCPYAVTFVGHSMGTIVLNKFFGEYHDELVKNGAVRIIVYMGAACSVGEAKQALIPLVGGMKDMAEPVQFYNLTLNRVAEVAESAAGGFAPRGSLLEYIDQHLEHPQTVLGRTMGSEVNVLAAIRVFQPIMTNSHFKAFDRIEGNMPQEHGDFNKCPFWEKKFWQEDTITGYRPNKQHVLTPINSYRADWAKLAEHDENN
jgi:hypothetical protein